MPHWGDRATTSNGFVPVRHLPTTTGLSLEALPAAIEIGRVKAMIIGNAIAGRFEELDPALLAALPKLEFLVVTDFYADTPLGKLAHVVLPMAMSMEKDGTFTSFDRTVQRLRAAVPPMGEAKDGYRHLLSYRSPHGLRDDLPRSRPGRRRDRQARSRVRRGHLCSARAPWRATSRSTSYIDAGTPMLSPAADGAASCTTTRSRRLSRLDRAATGDYAMFDEVKGFQVTFKRLFRPKVTIEYPEEKRHMAPRYRGLPSLRRPGDGRGALRRLWPLCPHLPDILPGDARRAFRGGTASWVSSSCARAAACSAASARRSVRSMPSP